MIRGRDTRPSPPAAIVSSFSHDRDTRPCQCRYYRGPTTRWFLPLGPRVREVGPRLGDQRRDSGRRCKKIRLGGGGGGGGGGRWKKQNNNIGKERVFT
jgi:hypothetical protein